MKRVVYLFIVLLSAAIFSLAYYWSPAPRRTATTPPKAPAAPISSLPVRDPGDEALWLLLDPKVSYEKRVAAIRQLPKVLNSEQADALHGLVLTKGVHPTIRNDVLLVLVSQSEKPKGIAKELVAMFHDQGEDLVWRDYCLQHLGTVYAFSPEKDLIESTLFEVARGRPRENTNYPGTALLSLGRLKKNNPKIAETLKKLARDGIASYDTDPQKAVTALQVARETGDRSILPQARKIAEDEQAIAMLRMSAIGTLGGLGESSDLALLATLSRNPNSRVKNAAKANLETLQKSLGSSSPVGTPK